MTKPKAAAVVFTILLFLLASVGTEAAQQADNDAQRNADMAAVRQYRLTMDKVEKLAAIYQAMYKMEEAGTPDAKESSERPTIDSKARELDKRYPDGTKLIHQKGFTTREYIVASVAFFNDLTIVTMKRQGRIQAYPAGSISPENAAFVENNYDKLVTLAKKMSPPADAERN